MSSLTRMLSVFSRSGLTRVHRSFSPTLLLWEHLQLLEATTNLITTPTGKYSTFPQEFYVLLSGFGKPVILTLICIYVLLHGVTGKQ